MATVSIDGENVEFEGDAPQTCGQACELIEGFLSGQGLIIESVSVDGEAVPLEHAFAREAYQSIDFKSISPQAQLLAMCKQWERECSELRSKMESLGGSILRSGWSDAQSSVVALLETLRPLIEGLGILQNFGNESAAAWSVSVGSCFEKALASIDSVVNAVEARNSVALSDALAEALAVNWGAMAVCLADEVLPALEGDLAQ